MKTETLIGILKKYPDYDIEFIVTFQPYADAIPEHHWLKPTEIADISYSDKRLILDTEYKEEESNEIMGSLKGVGRKSREEV